MATLISKCCEDTGRAMNVIHTELEELKFQRSHESKVSLALHFAALHCLLQLRSWSGQPRMLLQTEHFPHAGLTVLMRLREQLANSAKMAPYMFVVTS